MFFRLKQRYSVVIGIYSLASFEEDSMSLHPWPIPHRSLCMPHNFPMLDVHGVDENIHISTHTGFLANQV